MGSFPVAPTWWCSLKSPEKLQYHLSLRSATISSWSLKTLISMTSRWGHVPGQIPQDIWTCVTQFFSQKSVPLTPVPTQPPNPSRFSVGQSSISKQQRMLIKLYSLPSPSVEPALPQLSHQTRCPCSQALLKCSFWTLASDLASEF